VYFKNVILARNRVAPWGWSKKIGTCWSNFKCFSVKKFCVCALVCVLIKWSNLCVSKAPSVWWKYTFTVEVKILCQVHFKCRQ